MLIPFRSFAYIASIVLAFSLSLASSDAEPFREIETMDPAKKVNSEVGLIVRKEPSSKSAKVGTLENGTPVIVAGAKANEPGMIEAISVVDADDESATWIELAAPTPGWVLYYSTTGEDAHFFIVPRDE